MSGSDATGTDTDGDEGEAETADRARAVGINHVALSVGDVEEALEFYRSVFDVELRGRTERSVFLDMGDQFLAVGEVPETGPPDRKRHFGLVVDDPELVERRLEDLGVGTLDTAGLDFRDPWGNRIQVVGYADVQFSKADHVREAMGIDPRKTGETLGELDAKGMAPPPDDPARGGPAREDSREDPARED